ncbi:transcription antitermination factor NusB, partial [bacterium]|nr:transcription antitermination factor NusB [bacterium]
DRAGAEGNDDPVDPEYAEPEDRVFADKLVRLAVDNREACDELIIQKCHNWDFERIAIIDKLILRLAICELLYIEDIPPKVSIDEAIEVAKKYSTERSGQFINGILDSVLLDIENSNSHEQNDTD